MSHGLLDPLFPHKYTRAALFCLFLSSLPADFVISLVPTDLFYMLFCSLSAFFCLTAILETTIRLKVEVSLLILFLAAMPCLVRLKVSVTAVRL